MEFQPVVGIDGHRTVSRWPLELWHRLGRFAQAHGVSSNTALITLVTEGLDRYEPIEPGTPATPTDASRVSIG